MVHSKDHWAPCCFLSERDDSPIPLKYVSKNLRNRCPRMSQRVGISRVNRVLGTEPYVDLRNPIPFYQELRGSKHPSKDIHLLVFYPVFLLIEASSKGSPHNQAKARLKWVVGYRANCCQLFACKYRYWRSWHGMVKDVLVENMPMGTRCNQLEGTKSGLFRSPTIFLPPSFCPGWREWLG